LQDLSAIEALPDFRRLMRVACHRLGALTNQTELGRGAALSQVTAHRYLNLLEVSYLLVRLPAYSVNLTKRLVKSPNFTGEIQELQCIWQKVTSLAANTSRTLC
jgi:predicted AAA+ superfamily ATPase